MSTRLERSIDVRGFGTRSVGTLVAAGMLAVALAAMVLALFPAVAEAQTETGSPSSVVVRPGDSLWSISEARLGPDATPQRILEGVRRIHAFNRGRIGPDPGVILVGQELLVPPALARRPDQTRPDETATAHKTTGSDTGAAGAGPKERAAKGTAGEVPRTVPSTAEAKDAKPSATVAQRGLDPASLPDKAESAPVPAVSRVASSDAQPWSLVASVLRTLRAEVAAAASTLTGAFLGDLADGRAEGRRLLGLGVLALTLVVAALMAWKLPMRRTTREDAESWGAALASYYRYRHGYHSQTPAAHRTPPSPTNRATLRAPAESATDGGSATARRAGIAGAGIAAKEPRGRPPEGWEPGAVLRSTLGGIPLQPETDDGERLARLKPHLQEALGTLSRMERQGGLCEEDLVREEACRRLLHIHHEQLE